MEELRVSLLGAMSARLGDRRVDLGGAKSRALFGYLMLNPAVTHSRGHLAALFWPDASENKARQSLRSAIYQLRRGIDEAARRTGPESTDKTSDQILQIDKARVSVDERALIQTDVGDFTKAISQSEACTHELLSNCPNCVEHLETAASLYRGDFLADVTVRDGVEYDDWLLLHRESFQNQALRVLDRLVQLHHDNQDHLPAHDRAFQILELHRYDEFAHRVIITSLAAQGHRDQARQHYAACQTLFRDELGVELTAETIELAETLSTLDPERENASGSARQLNAFSVADALADTGHEDEEGTEQIAAQSILPFHRNPAFVGRKAHLEQLAEHLLPGNTPSSQVGAVVLSGIGGVGKTQLAIEYAYRYGHRYPGGVFLLDFADPGHVQAEIAAIGSERGLQLFKSGDRLMVEEQVARVQRLWQVGPPQLLIFDNCEHEDLAIEWLPARGPTSVLITSRKGDWPLELPLKQIPVEPLDRDASVAYLLQAATHIECADAHVLAAELGDHPLALHLAGQFLSRLRGLSVAEYVDQLRDSVLADHLSLRGLTSGYSPTAHEQCVQRTFALGYDQLAPNHPLTSTAKALLARIVCLAPGAAIDRMRLIATLADPTDAVALVRADNGVQRLIELGLVTTDICGRLVMHRLIYGYITSVLQSDDVLEPARLAIERCLSAKLTDDRFAAPNERFESPVQRVHLHHVTHAAIANQSHYAPALTLALGRSLRHDWDTASSETELTAGLAVARGLGNHHAEGRILSELVLTKTVHGSVSEVLEVAEQACTAFSLTEQTDPLWLAVSKDRLAASQWQAGQGELAHTNAREAVELSRAVGRPKILARSLRLLAATEAEVRLDYAAARATIAEVVGLLAPLDDPIAKAAAQSYLGLVCDQEGDYARALDAWLTAAKLLRESSENSHLGVTLLYAAESYLSIGSAKEAHGLLTCDIPEELGPSPFLRAMFKRVMARTMVELCEPRAALDSINEAFALGETIGDPMAGAAQWRVLGQVASALEETVPAPDEARQLTAHQCFERALTDFRTMRSAPLSDARTYVEWSRSELAAGRAESARVKAEEARTRFLSLNAPAHLDHHRELFGEFAMSS